MNCIFCDNQFADPVLPHNRQKICVLFNVSFNGKKLLHDGRICTRCQLQVDLIDNAMKIKAEMSQCLLDKLGGTEERLSSSANHAATHAGIPMAASPPPLLQPPKMEKMVVPSVPPLMTNGLHPSMQGPAMLASPSMPQASAAEMMAMASLQSSLAAWASAPMMAMPPQPPPPPPVTSTELIQPPATTDSKGGVYMCVNCGQAFKEHSELLAHDSVCSMSNRTSSNGMSPTACDRCGQSLKYRTPEERIKHIIQCKGQGLRRGRPSTGIINCHKCGLKLKNRMNHDRINHVQRCNGSGLKRGRPSLKSVDKFQCDKCNRNLWSRDQLELHASKCDGNHVERRGRKPGDNSCMVCGENLIYRHILKKHLRQAHGINPQNLDDSVIAAVKNEHSVDDLSTPYKKILLNQIQQHLTPPMPTMPGSPQPPNSEPAPFSHNYDESALSQSFDSALLGHRKKSIPCKYVATDGDSYSCDRCERVFEHRELFEQHSCFQALHDRDMEELDSVETLSNGEAFSCDRCEKLFENQQQYQQHECSELLMAREMDMSQPSTEETPALVVEEGNDQRVENSYERNPSPECVDDVVSAISERAEAVGSSSNIKGSAIAQVISGLLGANKQPSNSNGNASNLPPIHRQSIST